MATATVDYAPPHSWRIEMKGDHYAVVFDGMLIGTVERCHDDPRWGWYPIQWGTRLEYLPLRDALQQARQAAERMAKTD